ncbi:MAG TPA: DUF1800 domain-containing protein [Blastocatellia bacterium]|nr:DUF1800 domain-containing protein [Blastocatellia bacterium]
MASLSYDEGAHLLRRAGFGGAPEEIDDLSARGREGAVDFLINFNQIDNSAMESLLAASFDFSTQDGISNPEIRRWWFTRMVNTKRQFEEKMTLFWHNHFATSSSKVQDFLMFNQNMLLRQGVLDRFDNMLLKVSQDAAMLVWLDNITNVLGKPNENFGRELQELFTMGIKDVVTDEQNYTEQDVKEVARAFTGWNYRRQSPFAFQLNASQHDNGSKSIYTGTPWAQTGNLSGEDVITIISARPATARYLTWKLFNFFVYPVTTSSADKATIDKFAKVYLNNNHSIKELVRAIFTSDEFFSERAFFSLVKQPVELTVGAIRMLGGTYNQGTTGRGSATLQTLSRNMGQDLFAPPDVAGWDPFLAWVNTASMLERFNFANTFLTNRNTTNPGIFVTNDQLKSITKASSKKTVKRFLSRLGPLNVGGALGTLRTYLETGDNGQPVTYVNDDATVDKKIRGLVHQIMCLPEFQLN